jgi:hypothetical protein
MKAYIVHTESPLDSDDFQYEQRFFVLAKSTHDAEAEFAASMPDWTLKRTEERPDLSPSGFGCHNDTRAE